MPQVLNKRNGTPLNAVYIGRPSEWGNPFIISAYASRDEVIWKFRQYAYARIEREPNWLAPLRGRDLVCWCAPLACHGDVLIAMANR